MSRTRAYLIVAAACALPRLAVVFLERGEIMAKFTEKSDLIVETFVESGTFGFVPGEPTAYTQPLYGFFLTPIYFVFGRSWLAVGLAQTLVAVATALLVYELGRRIASNRVGLVGALIATLHPYVVWHDVHVNREVLDGLLAVAIAYLILLTADRRSWRLAAALGAVSGLAILGNARLILLPLVAIAYLAWRWRAGRETAVAALALAIAAAVTIAPWAIRNKVQVGCYAITTDSRALWKANNPATYEILSRGGWIDDVPDIPGAPPSPELAAGLTESTGKLVRVDECAQMRFYQDEVLDFWADEPGEKAKLAGQAVVMLWNPAERAGDSADVNTGVAGIGRRWIEPAYMSAVMALALGGVLLAGRRFVVLAIALLGYQTLAAMVFAGTPRYRAPWDFLLTLLAAVALVRVWERRRR
jgi:4-amino-4-deoxy-L-arabinose transferase-like glycosyltransferase